MSDSALKESANGASVDEKPTHIDPEVLKKIDAVRAQVRESFGKIAMAMMALPRYRHQTIADLQTASVKVTCRHCYMTSVRSNP